MKMAHSTAEPDRQARIAALMQTLHDTEQQLSALTAGGGDTVANQADHNRLLYSAQEQPPHQASARETALLDALPASVRRMAVLDRTKEPGAGGEPLLLDVQSALIDGLQRGLIKRLPWLSGGRYGLSSKEFTPAMCAAVFEELASDAPRPRFTVGIVDDVSGLSLAWHPIGDLEPASRVRALFFGLGADGPVGANKNSIKIIGELEGFHAQGYFVYDSTKPLDEMLPLAKTFGQGLQMVNILRDRRRDHRTGGTVHEPGHGRWHGRLLAHARLAGDQRLAA